MFIVMVIFEAGAHDPQDNETAVRDVVKRLVASQPGFRRARVHRGIGATPGMVVNLMEWDSEADFMVFRERHAAEVGAAMGAFKPRFTFFELTEEIPAQEVAA
jgi:heme-degrading monooxygenase HmoA